MRVRLRHDCLDFRNGNHGKEPTEEQEEREKEAKRSDHGANINPGWLEESPRSWQEVIRQGGNDNHVSLKPHANIDNKTKNEHQRNIGTNCLKPEKLRSDDVAAHHDEVCPPILAKSTIKECKLFV